MICLGGGGGEDLFFNLGTNSGVCMRGYARDGDGKGVEYDFLCCCAAVV